MVGGVVPVAVGSVGWPVVLPGAAGVGAGAPGGEVVVPVVVEAPGVVEEVLLPGV